MVVVVTSGKGGGLLSVTPSTLEFDTEGGSELIELKTDAGSWSLTQSDGTAWCTPERTSGRTSTSFHITVTSNAGGTERSTTLTFTAPGCEEVALTVRQAGDTPAGSEAVVAEPDPWDGVKRADISYQVLVYSFADGDGDTKGDLKGLTERLDYLDEMGVSAVWLSPIHPSSSYHGYDVLDYEAVNPTFGTDADLQAFIDAAHARGIRVYLDYVLNHTGRAPIATTTSSQRTRRATSPPDASTRSRRRGRPATTPGSGSRPTRTPGPRAASASSWTGATPRPRRSP